MLPAQIYFQGEDSQDLLLVSTLLFTVPQSLPNGCWFTSVFFKTKLPQPIAKDEKTGIPIYFLPVPIQVLREFVHGMKFPPLLEDMARHVPPMLSKTLSFKAWRTYLEYYGLLVEKAKDEDEPAKKKQRIAVTNESKPRFVFMRRVVAALADKIKAEHPKYPLLIAGQCEEIVCIFINTYTAATDGNFTYLLPIPGEPVVEPVKIAYDIGIMLPRYHCDDDSDYNEPAHNTISNWMEELFPPFKCYVTLTSTRKSKATKHIHINNWPAGNVTLTPGSHDVLRLTIRA